ncbi:hypothetical protein ACIA5G_25490 [Amycolatopsis sp. NPDC051758]|uniref:hypothetical protein n=1 Tax=Amycolatopsis sp. NPDC051758 TaxID=3363935 RepID=UPI0037A5FB7B
MPGSVRESERLPGTLATARKAALTRFVLDPSSEQAARHSGIEDLGGTTGQEPPKPDFEAVAPGLIRVSDRTYSSASMIAEEDPCEAPTVAVATC